MAQASDQLLVVAIISYALAMLAFAAEHAFGDRVAVGRAAVRQRERELVPVTTGATPPTALPPVGPAPSTQAEMPRSVAFAGRAAIALTAFGWLAQLACLVARGLAAHRVPWGNMYEFVLAVTLVGTTVWLVLVARRPVMRPLGLYVTLALVVLLGTAGMRLYAPAAPLVPALNSYWLKIHVTAAVVASGVYLVGFVAATLTLIRIGFEAGKTRFPYGLGNRVPAAEGLERLTLRIHAFAFPIWTFAVIAGAIWAEAAWGRYWGWDPKEVWSFIAWVVYAGYLHARATPSVKRSTVTWFAIAGWGAMMVNLFGVNLFIAGLHSYAGVN